MTNITHLDDYRARRVRSNVVQPRPRIDQVAERITRHRRAMDRLLQDMGLGWHHTCPHIGLTGMIPNGEVCIWCGAEDPNGPKGAA